MKFKIGLILIGISFLIALNPFLIYYAIPLFALGILSLWFSNKNLPYKIALTILPIVLWYPFMNLFVLSYMSFQETTRPRYDFIFPKDLKGTVIVVENMPCAGNPKKRNGRILLEFPDSGVLLYSGSIESNYMDNKYYKTDSNGKLTELTDFYWAASKNEKSELGVDHRYSVVGNLYLPERYIYTYQVLTVGLRNENDSIIISQDKKKELETIVKICISDKTAAASY